MAANHHFNSARFNEGLEIAAKDCMRNLRNWKPAVEEIRTWPEYEPQPLRELPGLAESLRINQVFFKDESKRFGIEMGSFKALGAPYAVYRLLSDVVYRQTAQRPTAAQLRTDEFRRITQDITVCVATDGNQGRGLAYGAKIFGCRCVVYIHNHVSVGRAHAMKRLGAIVIRVQGEYEASVERAKVDARLNGWYFVSSTSWSDFDDRIPQDVMNAYMVVVEEALAMLPATEKITHVFVCGGVGSIAVAIFLGFLTYFREYQGSELNPVKEPPRFIVVEPIEADCLFQSAKEMKLATSGGSLHTLMAGLACRSPSPAAWKILSWLGSDFISVPDSFAVEGMKQLASGIPGDIPIVCGESSAASMGLILQAARDDVLRQTLGLDESSQVLFFGLEGATDGQVYEDIVGRSPSDVFEAQDHFVRAKIR